MLWLVNVIVFSLSVVQKDRSGLLPFFADSKFLQNPYPKRKKSGCGKVQKKNGHTTKCLSAARVSMVSVLPGAFEWFLPHSILFKETQLLQEKFGWNHADWRSGAPALWV